MSSLDMRLDRPRRSHGCEIVMSFDHEDWVATGVLRRGSKPAGGAHLRTGDEPLIRVEIQTSIASSSIDPAAITNIT